MEKYAVRYCSKHPTQKMCLLFTSYVCDICSPPKASVQDRIREVNKRFGFVVGDKVEYVAPYYQGPHLVGYIGPGIEDGHWIEVCWGATTYSNGQEWRSFEKPEHLRMLPLG